MSDVLNIAVVCGGLSPEAEVSRSSGQSVAAALREKGHQVYLVEADRQGLLDMAQNPPDCAWLATHGTYGEDGTIQGFCELMAIPYTGASVAASAIAMNKVMTRDLLRASGLQQPKWLTVNLGNADLFVLPQDWQFPVIVKPAVGGSSIGINLVKSHDALAGAFYEALSYDDVVIVEQYISGRELSVAVFEGQVIGEIEIIPSSEIYDYKAKYESDSNKYIVEPELKESTRTELHIQALEAQQRLSCEGAIRIDFFLVGDDSLYFMELNTIPGMTDSSLLPKIAAHAGISFPELTERIAWQARLKCT